MLRCVIQPVRKILLPSPHCIPILLDRIVREINKAISNLLFRAVRFHQPGSAIEDPLPVDPQGNRGQCFFSAFVILLLPFFCLLPEMLSETLSENSSFLTKRNP